MTAKELKRILEDVPDETEVLMHLESKGGRAYEPCMGRHIVVKEGLTDEELDEMNIPYDGNCLIERVARTQYGVLILSDWEI